MVRKEGGIVARRREKSPLVVDDRVKYDHVGSKNL